jgi:Coenzyme PQQ synthesis protein D (PqqD)
MNSQPSSSIKFMPKETVVVASADQVSSDLAGESVILSLKSGTYYGLNPVGSSVWMLIQEPKTIAEICEAILEEYEVDAQTCEADIQALLADLLNAQLIELK